MTSRDFASDVQPGRRSDHRVYPHRNERADLSMKKALDRDNRGGLATAQIENDD